MKAKALVKLTKKTKYKYLPIVILIITNISWGLINMKTSGFLAIGPKGSAMNAINLATITHKHFNITYPEIRPDIHRSHEVKKIVPDTGRGALISTPRLRLLIGDAEGALQPPGVCNLCIRLLQ